MKYRSYLAMILGLTFVLSYQNCSRLQPVHFNSNSDSKAATNTDENGRPYDGKIYVLTGDACADGTNIQARIVLQNPTAADLVRKDCTEIAPIALTPSDFQINSNDSSQLFYNNQTFLNQLVGTKLDVSQFYNDGGYAWLSVISFPTTPDTSSFPSVSTLQLYEDGMPLGPAHSKHPDIRDLGAGRFSHWDGGVSTLRFSSSDNTNPLTNGRTYTWTVK